MTVSPIKERIIGYAKVIIIHDWRNRLYNIKKDPFRYVLECYKKEFIDSGTSSETGKYKLMRSNFRAPLNLGQDRMVSINELADIIAAVAGISIEKKYVVGPQGVRGRNSDNTFLREILDWDPVISLEDGLARTYQWIESQLGIKIDAYH